MHTRAWRRTGLTSSIIGAAVLAAACSSGSAASAPPATPEPAAVSTAPSGSADAPSAEPVGGSITVYNAQHESLTQAWVDEFTQADRRPGHAPQRRRHGARQPARAGGRRLPRGRLPDRELAGHGAGREGRAVCARRPGDARSGPGRLPSVHGGLDRDRRAIDGLRLQPDPAPGSRAAGIADRPPGTRLEGSLGGIAGRRRLPGDRQRAPGPRGSSPPPKRGWPA